MPIFRIFLLLFLLSSIQSDLYPAEPFKTQLNSLKKQLVQLKNKLDLLKKKLDELGKTLNPKVCDVDISRVETWFVNPSSSPSFAVWFASHMRPSVGQYQSGNAPYHFFDVKLDTKAVPQNILDAAMKIAQPKATITTYATLCTIPGLYKTHKRFFNLCYHGILGKALNEKSIYMNTELLDSVLVGTFEWNGICKYNENNSDIYKPANSYSKFSTYPHTWKPNNDGALLKENQFFPQAVHVHDLMASPKNCLLELAPGRVIATFWAVAIPYAQQNEIYITYILIVDSQKYDLGSVIDDQTNPFRDENTYNLSKIPLTILEKLRDILTDEHQEKIINVDLKDLCDKDAVKNSMKNLSDDDKNASIQFFDFIIKNNQNRS